MNNLQNNFFKLISPLSKFFLRIGQSFSFFFETLFNTNALQKENTRLLTERNALLSQVSQMQEIRRENQILREGLDLPERTKFDLVFAEIIGFDSVDSSVMFLINQGANDGIFENMPVITQDSVLVGKVAEVFSDYSKVMTVFCPQSSISAQIQDFRIKGVVQGTGGSGFIMNKLSKDVIVETGSMVITSGLDSIFPKGLVIGKIEKIEKKDVDIFQKAYIESLFDFNRMEEVFVIKPFNQ